MKPGAGWLTKDLSLPEDNHGIRVPRFSAVEQAPFPTRTEEYHHVAQVLEEQIRGLVVDAGCGFNPEIHLLPAILANMGYMVYAIDANPDVFAMPPLSNVERVCGTMAYINLPSASVDYWVCISVLEHLEPSLRCATMVEAFRLLKPGGLVLLTADDVSPERLTSLMVETGFRVGPTEPFTGAHLSPPVSWAIGQKP